MSPSSSFWLVRALNCLQNSIMLICAWPSAGPTGGAGVALPAAICNFTEPVTFFAMIPFSAPTLSLGLSAQPTWDYLSRNSKPESALGYFLHLPELQLHRSRAPENRDHHLQGLAVLVDLVHHAGEAGKRPFGDAHRFVLLELDLELGLVLRLADAINDVLHFFFRQRCRLLARAHKARHTRRGLHHVPHVVVHIHFHQHIAGIEHSFAGVLLAAANLGDRLGRDQHAADLVLQTKCLHPRFQRLAHFALKSRIGVDDVPLHVRITGRLHRFRGFRCFARRTLDFFFFCHTLFSHSQPYRCVKVRSTQ